MVTSHELSRMPNDAVHSGDRGSLELRNGFLRKLPLCLEQERKE